jgi:hypothetical protein
MSTILLVIVVLLLLGALPRWPHSRNWVMAPPACSAWCSSSCCCSLLDRAPD